MRKPAFAVVVMVAAANLAIWVLMNRPASEIPWYGAVKGFSYSPYRVDQNPFDRPFPSSEQIENDLALLADNAYSVRIYTVSGGVDKVPGIAQKYGLNVTAGAWLDKRIDNNRQEVEGVISLAQRYHNIDRLIIGNESVLRGDLTVPQLRYYLRWVRHQADIPVSTAEPWHVWLKNPELASEVDFIAVHLLPYWERLPIDKALDYVLQRYQQLQKAFPNKPILVAEVGWPSNGSRFGGADPSLTNQAQFIRQFLNVAYAKNIDYFIMEAFDQPWKKTIEGSVGAYWGLFNGERQPKFSLMNIVIEDTSWSVQALISTLLALLPMLLFAANFDLRLPGHVFYAVLIQGCVSLLVSTAFVPSNFYLSAFGLTTMSVMIAAQLALLAVVLINGLELTEMLWNRGWKRHFVPLPPQRGRPLPKVSLHLPCYNEPPNMVIETLKHLAQLDYPDFEVLVIDNNTTDPAIWRPVKAYCARLGARFRFFHLESWPGYKAGALNFALGQTDPDAEVIGVVDSDYVVEPNWLLSLIPYFDDPQIGFIQAPQDHRAWKGNLFKGMCNWEYTGFFNIGMVHRNERNAIIQHGTMTLIRRLAFQQVGEWAEWCICEDTELGLRLMNAGYEAVYVNHVFGRGLTPDSYAAYKSQRFRWAYGAVQILKRYWRWMLPGGNGALTWAQRFHFATGWLPWFADALHLLFTGGALLWTVGLLVLPSSFEFPLPIFVLSVLGMFFLKSAYSLILYRARVHCNLRQRLGAAIASLGLTHTIGRAVLNSLCTRQIAFLRTPKCENRPALVQGLMTVREELLIFVGLWLAALGIASAYGTELEEALYWIILLGVQSLPYGAAVFHSLASTLADAEIAGLNKVTELSFGKGNDPKPYLLTPAMAHSGLKKQALGQSARDRAMTRS